MWMSQNLLDTDLFFRFNTKSSHLFMCKSLNQSSVKMYFKVSWINLMQRTWKLEEVQEVHNTFKLIIEQNDLPGEWLIRWFSRRHWREKHHEKSTCCLWLLYIFMLQEVPTHIFGSDPVRGPLCLLNIHNSASNLKRLPMQGYSIPIRGAMMHKTVRSRIQSRSVRLLLSWPVQAFPPSLKSDSVLLI